MTDSMSESLDPLLAHEKGLDGRSEHGTNPVTARIQVGLLSLISMVLAWIAVVLTLSLASADTVIYSPANVALRTDILDAWDEDTTSPYLFSNRDRATNAWNQLLADVQIRISEEEIYQTQTNFSKFEDTVIHLNGGGYAGILGVHHHLHCIHLLIFQLHRDEYKLDAEDQVALNVGHFDHCLDVLRAHVMCQPDLTLYPLAWTKSSDEFVNKAARTSSKKACANYGAIAAWTRERSVSIDGSSVRPSPFDRD